MDGYACIAPAVEWSIENLEQVIYAGKWVFLTSFPVVRSLRVWCAVVCVLVLSVSSELWVLINNILWKKIKEWYRCEDMYRWSWHVILLREKKVGSLLSITIQDAEYLWGEQQEIWLPSSQLIGYAGTMFVIFIIPCLRWSSLLTSRSLNFGLPMLSFV